MSASRINQNSKVFQLDGHAGPDEVVTPEDAQDPDKLSRLLIRLLKGVAELTRRWNPRRMDFEDRVSTGTDASPQAISFTHGFGGRVRWWIVDAQSTGSIVLPLVLKSASTTDNVLVLNVYYPMTFTLRVEEAG